MSKTRRDPSTCSNYDVFLATHTVVSLDIDFAQKIVRGNVKVKFRALRKTRDEHIVLDTSYLNIGEVQVDGKVTACHLESRVEPRGSALKVPVHKTVELDNFVVVQISVCTTSQCTALQWFEPEQTSNKLHPYVFSQCQAIHARSVIPCQDTPDVKSTYEFNIRSPLPVFASGLPIDGEETSSVKGDISGSNLYMFRQDVPIPSYLIAFASGNIAKATIGPRSCVATNPEKLGAAKWELEEHTERFLQAAEKVVRGVPYVWSAYNVLVLPPSFPYGGMENPVYTYATPTIISGDRQNVDVVAHEIAHSWSGNLVTNCSWEHFWWIILTKLASVEADDE